MNSKIIFVFIGLIVLALAETTVEYRSINGTGNNKGNPLWGSINVPLERKLPLQFDDGFSVPTGGLVPSKLLSARLVSNSIVGRKPEYEIPNQISNSILTTFWGQFIDHDTTFSLDTSDATGVCNFFNITIPKGDPFFDSGDVGGKTMQFCRLAITPGTGTNLSNPLKFPNIITSYIDVSTVYGYNDDRARALRTFSNGLLNSSKGIDGEFPPINNDGKGNVIIAMANAAKKFPDNELFMSGDLRANENPVLLSLHTLFLREHNRRARLLPSSMNDEEKYQEARKMVIAHVQAITFNEFLPAILGVSMPKYTAYDPTVNPNIVEFFSTAAYRFGHDQLTDVLLRLDPLGKSISQGPALLRDVFFDVLSFNTTGVSAFLRGAAVNPQRIVDSVMEDDVRLFLYGRGPATAFDLSARNIQRARDIGMGFYNDARKAYGLAPCSTFSCVTDDPVVVQILNNLYGANNVSYLDCFIGGLLEPKTNANSKLGALFSASLVDQFTRMRNGDRFWYQNPGVLTKAELAEIEATKLSDIIKRNTDSIIVPADVFNRKDVTPEQVYNPPENSKWIIAIIVLSIVAAVCIIVIIGLCFAKSNNRMVDDNKLYEELNHN